MTQKQSKFDHLMPEIQRLVDEGKTVDQITAELKAVGEGISRSTVGKMRKEYTDSKADKAKPVRSPETSPETSPESVPQTQVPQAPEAQAEIEQLTKLHALAQKAILEQDVELGLLREAFATHQAIIEKMKQQLGEQATIIEQQAAIIAQYEAEAAKRGKAGRKTKLTDEVIAEIQQMRNSGMSFNDIAAATGLSVGSVQKCAPGTVDLQPKQRVRKPKATAPAEQLTADAHHGQHLDPTKPFLAYVNLQPVAQPPSEN